MKNDNPTDIVERLRDDHSELSGETYRTTISSERKEAADEIERLRTDSAKWLNRSAELRAEINIQADEAADEIEQLRRIRGLLIKALAAAAANPT